MKPEREIKVSLLDKSMMPVREIKVSFRVHSALHLLPNTKIQNNHARPNTSLIGMQHKNYWNEQKETGI